MQHIFIVGSKGCGNYGGFETFVDQLTARHQDHPRLRYHVAWKGRESREFTYHNARCFQVKVPDIGAAQAVYYDLAALRCCVRYIEAHQIQAPIVYVLACRIGPAAAYFQARLHKLGGRLYVNPDGHEWLRGKWPAPVRRYWKLSEGLMVKNADLLVCDSRHIERYIQTAYARYAPKTAFIAYGTDLNPAAPAGTEERLRRWYAEKGLAAKDYYLVVGRFVPENSFEAMIREFMRSRSRRNLAIVTTEDARLFARLEERLHFSADGRIRFVGTVYDQALLRRIRESAYAYLHGHTVGGTNPSLIEALGSTSVNLLVDVPFNREAAEDGALYWSLEEGSLAALIDRADAMPPEDIAALGRRARERVEEAYTWEKICGMYERLFLDS